MNSIISRHSKNIFFYYIFIFIWWIFFFITGRAHAGGITLGEALYQFAFGLIPLLGGVFGLIKSKKWGGYKSYVGRALLAISAGAVCWGVGQMFWSLYYNILTHVDIPYPSLADVGYSLSFPFLTIGLISLSKATGARFSLKHPRGKILALFITVVGIIAAYYLLVVVARGGVISSNTNFLKIFFDFAYPLGDLTIFLFSLLMYGLSFNYLGGRYKLPILGIILGLLVLFFGDFSFSYTTTIGSYYNGHWVDIILPTAWMLIVFGVNSFDVKD
ncbi:MAG TPA: hypothetical protein VGO21_03250 [Candidatus Paceibacterota bacterium]|jgi:hypothetical protein|nr:hypothetical protein [Candidatus Paceibacterota bacterium]